MSSVRLDGVALEAALFGAPTRLGVVIGTTTSKNNHDTATPFNNTGDALGGKLLVLQPDVACYIAVGSVNTVAAATTDVKLEANERFVLNCGLTHKFVATRSVSGTVNLQVYELI
jgi:hypothetical protein